MPFLTDLEAKKLDERRNTWRLDSPLRYCDQVLCLLLVAPTAFVTNFATLYIYIFGIIIRIPFAYWLLADLGDAAATIHDWLYCTQELTRRQCDAVFRRALIDLKIPKWRAWAAWLGLRLFGWTVWMKIKHDKKCGKFEDPIEQTVF